MQSHFNLNEPFDLTIQGEKINTSNPIIKMGSKYIYNIGQGSVIEFISSDPDVQETFINAEIALSHKLTSLCLHTMPCEKIMVEVNGRPMPALKMPSFAALQQQGKQVRDCLQNEYSSGDTLLFGNIENMQSIEHWRKMFKHIKDEIAIYLINNFKFPKYCFHLIIQDSDNTANLRKTQASLFCDLEQALHLCFFNYNNAGDYYKENKNYSFVNTDGSIAENEIKKSVEALYQHISHVIDNGMLYKKEYKVIFPTPSEEFELRKKTYDPLLKILWDEITPDIVTTIKNHLEKMTTSERIEQYLTDEMKCEEEIRNREQEKSKQASENMLLAIRQQHEKEEQEEEIKHEKQHAEEAERAKQLALHEQYQQQREKELGIRTILKFWKSQPEPETTSQKDEEDNQYCRIM